jgi:hypothetical protein
MSIAVTMERFADTSPRLKAMQVQINFLRLFKEVAIGDRIDGWRVCWIGGWDKCRVVSVVMVEKRISANGSPME